MEPIVYVLDAQPLVGSFKQEPSRPTVEALIARGIRGEVQLRLTTVNAGEVTYAVERALGANAGHEALRTLQDWPIDIVNVDLELASRAGWFKLRGRISYADCFAAALAHRDGIPLVSDDPEFERVADVVRVIRLAELP